MRRYFLVDNKEGGLNFAPIALFVYNRPEHTRRTVAALKNNVSAQDSVLYVFSDASKTPHDVPAVQEIRDLIKDIAGFKQVVIAEQVQNQGLAKSIIDGVSGLCEKYGRVIVLEDDLETSPYFLTFMNEALNYYEHEEKVMHISGYRYPVQSFEASDTFFLSLPLCWGWATWRRSWRHFAKDINVMDEFDGRQIKRFDFDDTYPFWKQLELNRSGVLNTWFIFWYADVFLRGGLALFPARSLVRNIGMDDSGTHSFVTNDYDVELSRTPVTVASIPLVESSMGYKCHSRYFSKIRLTWFKRVKRKFARWAGW